MEISRRDFLKSTALFAGALAVPGKVVSALSEESPEKFGRFGRLETENAYYYPFFEIHGHIPDIAASLREWGVTPKVHFREVMDPNSAAAFLSHEPPTDYIFSNVLSVAENSSKPEDYGNMFSNELLNFFYEKDVPIAFEGIQLPEKLADFHGDIPMVESLGTVGLGIASMIRNMDGKRGLLEDLGTTLAIAWGLGTTVPADLAVRLEMLPESKGLNDVKDAIWNVDRLVRDFHPEQMIAFFRNLVMARKLQTLAKYYSITGEKKPDITFSAGLAHGGIKDLLTLGESVTLAGFNLYPKAILKDVVDINGGIEPFCTTLVVSVRNILTGQAEPKQLVLDKELKDYLETRLE